MAKLLVVLTQYKRNHLEEQLESINNQTVKPDYLVVLQNENHVDITHLKNKYDFIHIHSDFNTKFFGRFANCFVYPVDICMILDDDIIPGKNCLKNYMEQCLLLNSIIGGNGRIGYNNNSKLKRPREVGIRNENTLVDFVGHIWCFKKEWLHYMFAINPFTYDTGEDMHLCYSSKVLGDIKSYVGKQTNKEDMCDIKNNAYAGDNFASYRTTSGKLRKDIENYFIENHNLELIKCN